MIIMSFVNFTLLIFLLRIEPRGTFFLVGAYVKVSIGWTHLVHPKSSAEFALHRHSGMLALVIQPHLLFAIFFIVMSFLVCLVIKILQCVMHVSRARVINSPFHPLVEKLRIL
jgi:hypothetical protein